MRKPHDQSSQWTTPRLEWMFLKRAIAYGLDIVALYVLTVSTMAAAAFALWETQYGGKPAELLQVVKSPIIKNFGHAAHLLYFFAYFTLSHWYFGRTPGKWLLGLKVVSEERNELTFGAALLRSAGYFASGWIALGLGFVMPIFRKDHRALQDVLASTYVIDTRAKASVSELPISEPKAA